MPVKLERALRKVAQKYVRSGKLRRKKGQTVEQAKNAFVYGTMRKQGWAPRRRRKWKEIGRRKATF